jgi:deoxycytidine triphosphate deaminase
MARQGNYVTVSNIDANWAGDLSKTLGNLGSKYADLATEEKKAAERLAEAEENKRRYEQGRLDTAARNAVLDARAEQTRQDSILRWVRDFEEKKRQWDIEEGYRKRTEDRAIEDRTNRLKQEEAKREANKALWGIATPGNKPFELRDYSEPVRSAFTSLIDRVNTEKGAVKSFLTDDNQDTANLQAASAAYRASLEATKLPPKTIDEMVAQRESDLVSLKDELTFTEMSDAQRADRINAFLGNRYDTRLDEIYDKIKSGSKGMSQGEQVRALMDEIPENYREYLDIPTMKAALANVTTGKTDAALIKAEQDRVDALNQATLKNIELYKQYLSEVNRGVSGSKFTKNTKGIADALKEIGKVDIGWLDTEDAKEGFQILIDRGIDPSIAAASIAFGIDKGVIEDSFPSTTSDAFAEIVAQADKLNQIKSSSGGLRAFPSREMFKYTPVQPKSLGELKKESITFSPNDNSRLALDPYFDRGKINTNPMPKLDRPQPVDNSNTDSTDTPKDSDTPSVSPQDNTADVNIILPKPIPLKANEFKNLPQNYQDIAAKLDPKVRAELDLSWPSSEQTARGTRASRVYTDQELISREILDTVQELENSKAALARLEGKTNPTDKRLASRRRSDIIKAEEELMRLREQLLNPQ